LTTACVVKLEPYLASYWFSTAQDGAAFLVALALGGMAAQPLWAWRARDRSAVRVLPEAALALALGGASFSLSAAGPAALIVSGLVYGIGQGGLSMLLWSLLAEASQRARRRAAALFGTFTFVAKAAGAFSTLFLSHALATSHYQTAEADLTQLALLITLVPALGAAGLIGLSYDRRRAAPAVGL